VAVAITNHSQEPQFVSGAAVKLPQGQTDPEQFAVDVASVSTVRYVLGPWDTGSYVGMTLRHAGNAPTNHDVKINCGPPAPSAHAFTTCRWPGGRDIWVELGNTGTGDTEVVVSYLLSGDDQVIPSQHTVAPGDSETVNIPVNYNGTWFVDVREQVTNEHLVDEKLTIDCEPIDDTVELPSAPEGKDENDPGVNSITPVSGEESNPESQVEDSSPTVTEIPGEQDTSSGPAELDLETVADTPSQSTANNNMAVMGLTAAGAAAAAVAAVAVRKRR